MPVYGLREKPLCCGNISVLAQKEVNSVALLINCSIKVLPFPASADVGFIHSPRPTDRASETIPLLLVLRYEAQYPSKDCSMSEIDATLSHHVSEVAIAELVSDVPTQLPQKGRFQFTERGIATLDYRAATILYMYAVTCSTIRQV